ncbi:MAG TPA: hypothetical protein VHE53_01860 [Patescibacteria group bacterium]|nr:hypothetical protein [Patescibacteria group bacterium]
MEKEKQSFARRAEVVTEKVGGGILVLEGILAPSVALVGIGAFLFLLGQNRQPR